MINEKIEFREGLIGTAYRGRINPLSTGVDDSKKFSGRAPFLPQVGLRFRCGSLDTNVVAKIVEVSDEEIRFETLSGSLYVFEIEEMGEITKTVDYPKENIQYMKERISDYVEKGETTI